MARNPAWTRDELILALDLYFRINPLHASEKTQEIQELSRLLNELPLKVMRMDEQRFRNPYGVHMKLQNFLRFDPNYKGVGLTKGGHLEEEIWNEYSTNRKALTITASAIRATFNTLSPEQVEAEIASNEDMCMEGALLTALHRRRERSPSVTKKKKRAVLEASGVLACEVCGFDFKQRYGVLGEGFAECHHTISLSSLGGARATQLKDLAIVCANCHRIIHRTKPMLALDQLKSELCI